MRRTAFVVLLFLLVAVSVPAGAGLAQTGQPPATTAAADVRADFDNDGFSDLAVGAPTESVGSSSQAGAVTVLYATAGGLTGSGSQLFTQDTPGSRALSSQATSSAPPWRPETSTMMALPIWPSAPAWRTPAPGTPARSLSCTAQPKA